MSSEININDFKYQTPDLLNDYFPEINNIIHLKDHKIKALYKENNLSLNGVGKLKLEKKFDKIEYFITNKSKNFNLIANLILTELTIKNQKFLKNFLPKINETIDLKNHKVKINYKNKNLFFHGLGKIKLEKEFEEIDYSISQIDNKFNFDTKLNLDKTLLNIDSINYKKDNQLDTQISIIGIYEKDKKINFKKVSIIDKDNKIILTNLSLNEKNEIMNIDKVDLDYFDVKNKKNKFLFQKKQKDKYELIGSTLNANDLISNLLKNDKDEEKSKIFKDDINININLDEVYIDNETIVKKLKGDINIVDNKVHKTKISALFNENEHLTFTINTNNEEKITTLFSSRAKPLVKRYKFIKGFEEGYLDFYSSKKNNISKSKLNIYNFKLQELPTLTKLLTLASLQGIADILSGEGIRFKEFEMNFNNQGSLMTIDEIYAIGPAISILMSGYVEKDKLISLRGTLVPATTVNKTISSIPVLGKILVGNKVGEGVFGVSFKIKGPPKNLETTVNPIKTLTPRFITRTLEKIKKN